MLVSGSANLVTSNSPRPDILSQVPRRHRFCHGASPSTRLRGRPAARCGASGRGRRCYLWRKRPSLVESKGDDFFPWKEDICIVYRAYVYIYKHKCNHILYDISYRLPYHKISYIIAYHISSHVMLIYYVYQLCHALYHILYIKS